MTYNFAKYSGSYAPLLDEEAREALPHLTFERDQLEAEAMKEEVRYRGRGEGGMIG